MITKTSTLAALTLLPLLAAAAGALPMAGTLRMEEGVVALQRARSPRLRRVEDFARVELGDLLKVGADSQASLALFDSGAMVLDSGADYRVSRDGIYKSFPLGSLRIYQYARPLDREAVLGEAEVMLGSVGTVHAEGSVHLRRAGETRWREVEERETLYYHDTLRTEGEGRAVVTMGRRASLEVEEESTVLLQKDAAVLERGGLLTHWRRRGHRFEIHTPMSVVGVRGTVFRVQTEDGAGDRVGVYEGRVVVSGRAERRSRSLDAGMLARVSPVGSVSSVERLTRGAQARRWARTLQKSLGKVPPKAERAAYLGEVMDTVHRMDDPREPLPRTRRRAGKEEAPTPARSGAVELGRAVPGRPDRRPRGREAAERLDPPEAPSDRRAEAAPAVPAFAGSGGDPDERVEQAANGWSVTVSGGSPIEPPGRASSGGAGPTGSSGSAGSRSTSEAEPPAAGASAPARGRGLDLHRIPSVRPPGRSGKGPSPARLPARIPPASRRVPAGSSARSSAGPSPAGGSVSPPKPAEPAPARQPAPPPVSRTRGDSFDQDPLGGPISDEHTAAILNRFQL